MSPYRGLVIELNAPK